MTKINANKTKRSISLSKARWYRKISDGSPIRGYIISAYLFSFVIPYEDASCLIETANENKSKPVRLVRVLDTTQSAKTYNVWRGTNKQNDNIIGYLISHCGLQYIIPFKEISLSGNNEQTFNIHAIAITKESLKPISDRDVFFVDEQNLQ